MLRSISTLLLPIASFVVFVLMFLILNGPLQESRGVDFVFAFGCTPFCWSCSIACGLHAVKRKKTTFPKSEGVSKILLYFSFFSILASGVALASGRDIGLLLLAFFVLFCGAVCCLVSIFITFIIVIRDVLDLHTWVIFITQMFWMFASFYFHDVAADLFH